MKAREGLHTGHCMWTRKKFPRHEPSYSAGRPSNNSKGDGREGSEGWEGKQETYCEGHMPISF